MKIAYVGTHGNTGSDDTEGHIAHALRTLGHEVTTVCQTSSPAGCSGADVVLFHHWYNVHPGFLERLPGRKVCWYFDKAWNGREKWLRAISPLCDRLFMTDGTWAASSGLANVRVLRQGIGDRDAKPGTPRPERWKAKVVFTGSLYGERLAWAKSLIERYGDDFAIVKDVFNRDLYDLCATVPIVVAPPYPADDHYWSNRIYLVLGSGGFLAHPRLGGLSAELVDGEHFAGYGSSEELFRAIDHFLAHPDERAAIAAAGYERMHSRFTFTDRVKDLLCQLESTKERRNTSKK